MSPQLPSPCLHDFVRRAYYGGRVEVFRSVFAGPGVLYYGDVNSMYPAAMLSPVPAELSYVRTGPCDITKAHALGYLGFIECTVSIPESCYLPLLPYRHDHKLIFPTGEFNGCWTSEELAHLPRIGGIIKEYRHSIWFRGHSVFKNYVNHWYKFRNQNLPGYSVGLALIAKFFLNNLYGKFGQTRDREKLHFFPTDEDFKDKELVPVAAALFGCFSEKVIVEPSYVIPHISAWVTARARVLLWSLMRDMLDAGHQIYYCDTDSIIGTAPVESSTELGALKLECKVTRAKFVAPKMYYLEKADSTDGGSVKAKGFSGGFGAKGLTEREFDRLTQHIAKVKINRMRKMKEGLKTGMRFPAMMHVKKGVRVGVLNTKRETLPDGNTKAIHLTLESK